MPNTDREPRPLIRHHKRGCVTTKAAEKFRKTEHERNTIDDILKRNGEVEAEIKAKTTSGSLSDATVKDFLDKSLTVAKLQDFIHARMFDSAKFQRSKLVGSDGNLNKICYLQYYLKIIK